MNLADLPQFNVDTVQERDGEVRLSGRLSHLRGVRAGRSWLYAGIDASIIGDLEIVDHATANAVFITSDRVLAERVTAGASLPWVDGYWQAYQIAMIVDPGHPWAHTVFAHGSARHFTLNGAHGWQPADAPLPDGATDLGVRAARALRNLSGDDRHRWGCGRIPRSGRSLAVPDLPRSLRNRPRPVLCG
jgi:hypothetical protein